MTYASVDAEEMRGDGRGTIGGGQVKFGEKYRLPYYTSRDTQGYVSIYISLYIYMDYGIW